jgi:hypothetical protein
MYIPLVLKLTMHSIRKFLIHITVFSVIHSIALDKLLSDMHSYTFCLDVYYIFFVVKMPGAHMPGAQMPEADMTGRTCRGAHAWERTCRGRVRCILEMYRMSLFTIRPKPNSWRPWPNRSRIFGRTSAE